MSEIRVNNVIADNGLDAVNFAKGINVSSGIITATSFSGSGASLTSLPAANLTGTLPAISGANLTNVSASGYTATSSTTLNSTSFDYTGFSADTRMFDVVFRSVATASVDWGIRIGDSGGIETSSYVCRSGFDRSSSLVGESNTGGFFSHGLAGSYTTSGFFRFAI